MDWWAARGRFVPGPAAHLCRLACVAALSGTPAGLRAAAARLRLPVTSAFSDRRPSHQREPFDANVVSDKRNDVESH
jgi:hypothetical protein